MTKHVMVDIETLGTGAQSAILSIGAVRFDPDPKLELVGDRILDKFQVGVTMQSNHDFKRVVDPNTLEWWFNPAQDQARLSWWAMEKVPLSVALDGLGQWIHEVEQPEHPVWGNGAAFDNVVLRNAYQACGLIEPWAYRDDRCFRTMKNLGPHVGMPEPIGVTHNALDDAIFQTQWLLHMVDHLGVDLG